MKHLLANPWFTCGLYTLLRMLLAPLSPVPGAVPLDPLWVFLAMDAKTPPRIRVPALLPGLIIGDLMAGLPWPVIALRSAGLAVLANVRLEGGFHRRFAFWMVHHALFSAVMSDWLGDYPLGFLYAVWLPQGLLWWGLAAPRGERIPWRALAPMVWLPVCLAVLHLFFHAPPLWPPPRLGSHSGFWMRTVASLLLLIPLAAALLRRSRRGIPPDRERSGWMRWAE